MTFQTEESHLFQCKFVRQILKPVSPKHFSQSLSDELALFQTLDITYNVLIVKTTVDYA